MVPETKRSETITPISSNNIVDQIDIDDQIELVVAASPIQPLFTPKTVLKCEQGICNKIFIVGDSNGENCVSVFNKLLRKCGKSNYLVTSFFKPNALCDDVIADIPKVCKDFTPNDHVIILAGTSNALQGKTYNGHKLFVVLEALSQTNVTLVSTTYCKGRTVLNKFMYDFNCGLVKTARCFHHVNYVETNKVMAQAGVYNFYPVLSLFVRRLILECVLYNLVLGNSNCLVFVPLCNFDLNLNDVAAPGTEIALDDQLNDGNTLISPNPITQMESNETCGVSDGLDTAKTFFRDS